MNFPIIQCPQCNNHTKVYLQNDYIHTNCKCGFHSTKKTKDFIKDNKKDKFPIIMKDNTFKDIIIDINKGDNHLLTYFKIIKKEHISRLIRLMNELESSYEESYNRNKDMLAFIQILIDHYDGTIEMKNNIMDNSINISECKDSKNIDEVIKFYKEYNIIRRKMQIEEVRCITEHTDYINSLFLLKDGRVASCSNDNTIRIYDPFNDYHCAQVIQRHSNGIKSICQLDDGTIVSCSFDGSIMLGDYTISNAHYSWMFSVITLSNNRIASSSDDTTVKIWKSSPPYSQKPIKVLKGHSSNVTSLLYIKERNIMVSGSKDETLRLWNLSTYQCYKVIEGVLCCLTNSLYQIDNDRILIGGEFSFCIVNIDKCAIENTIKNESLRGVLCFLKFRDEKTILCGCDDGIFYFYNMDTQQYRITKNNHNEHISDLLLLDNCTFLSCSDVIKVWKY